MSEKIAKNSYEALALFTSDKDKIRELKRKSELYEKNQRELKNQSKRQVKVNKTKKTKYNKNALKFVEKLIDRHFISSEYENFELFLSEIYELNDLELMAYKKGKFTERIDIDQLRDIYYENHGKQMIDHYEFKNSISINNEE